MIIEMAHSSLKKSSPVYFSLSFSLSLSHSLSPSLSLYIYTYIYTYIFYDSILLTPFLPISLSLFYFSISLSVSLFLSLSLSLLFLVLHLHLRLRLLSNSADRNKIEYLVLSVPSVTEVLERKASKPHCASVFTFSKSIFLSTSAFTVNVRSAIPQE